MGRLFGTDGVRGLANADLTPALALRLATSAAQVLASEHWPSQPLVERSAASAGAAAAARRGEPARSLCVGRDPRASGEMLEAAVAAGLASAGVDVLLLGVLPTPAVAFLTADLRRRPGRGDLRLAQRHAGQRHQDLRGRRPQARRRGRGRHRGRMGLRRRCRPASGVGRIRPAADADRALPRPPAGRPPRNPLDGLRVVVDCAQRRRVRAGARGLPAGRRRGDRDRRRARTA